MAPSARTLAEQCRAAFPDPAAGVVVALSGGPDSVALLHLLLDAGLPPERILAAHLDHALRPDSAADAELAGRIAAAAGVRFRAARVPGGAGPEGAARRVRYLFLEEVAREEGLPLVATAHHADDQAETLLLRLLRGAGPRGLAGIRARRPLAPGSPVTLVRPLLSARRDDLRRYLAERGLPWRTDPTNLDGSNLRSRLRTRLLPALDAAVPFLVERLLAVAELAADLRPADPGPDPDGFRLTAARRALPSALRDALLARLPPDGPSPDRRTLERVRALFDAGGGRADLGAGWSAQVGRRRVTVLPPGGPRREDPYALTLPVPGRVEVPGTGRIEAAPTADGPTADPSIEVIDADRAQAPFRVRPARPGDRFRPLGYGAETSVFRFLGAQGVARAERGRVPLVLSADGRPVWVVGYRIDEQVAIGEGTVNRLRMQVGNP